MKRILKKATAVVLTFAMVVGMSTAVFADQSTGNVFCNFICAGQITGKTIPAGSNVTAPSVPVVGGFTFCGFDKSLRNITSNTTFTAVYVADALGKDAIAAKKASLPTPAISATTVADPNATPAIPAVALPQATTPGVAAVSPVLVGGAMTHAVASPADQANLLLLQQAILAQQAQQAALKNNAANQAAAQTQNTPAQVTAPAVTAPVATPAVSAVPSWVVGLEGVDAAGAANAYNYLKNTKGLDDATIQANWGAFMHHYAGHGVAGW